MKRRLGSVLAAPIVPALFLFVLTAQPARLYAESSTSVPSTTCASLQTAPCEGKASGDACTTSGGKAGACKFIACKKEDGTGTSVPSCVVTTSTQPTPGTILPEDETDAGTGSSAPSDDGCAVGPSAGGASSAGGFALAGVALALSLFARRLRRR